MRLETSTRRFYLGRDYSEAIEHFGAIPVHIGLIPNRESLDRLVNELDGVLLPGSDTDVDPLRFDEEPHHRLKNVVPEKDETDLIVLQQCEARGLPVLAICYGMQILNVSRGGTLIQDIESQVSGSIKHEQGIPLDRNSHSIESSEDSIIARLITTEKVLVNSHHHQSIKEPGENLRVTARAKDGVIECIEDIRPDRFVLGVQWHPEIGWRNNRSSSAIFQEFVDRARQFSSQKGDLKA
ncbi:MAG: gamma-glutamyl-gamma-aminobutyrate hydrolase family protein [Pyrinomonadaceae bacterium]|nr:gamma-glutamyl-gamma-aminobutyrate hydrolase family protein [Pyrinomonadaceae bacterium]